MKDILRAYKYELKPDADQRQYLAKSFGCARYVWNENVANLHLYLNRKDGYEKNLTYSKLVAEGAEFLREVSCVILQFKEIDFKTYKKQFFNKNRKVKLGKPNYKSRKGRQSIRFTAGIISTKSDIDNGLIGLPKYKKLFKFENSRKFTGELRSVTVSLEPSGKYYISFLVKEQYEQLPSTSKAVGIDVGIKDLLVLSSGIKFDNPKYQLEKANRALKNAQKQLSRKSKGSKNREKARLRAAKCYSKITRIRNNYYHNISKYLVSNFDEIYMEDLAVQNMLKNRRLSRAIHEASWSTLIGMIKYKSEWNDRDFHQISRWFPSSKTCSNCGHKLSELDLGTRSWICPDCGTHHDRDLNAAQNILKQGQIDLYDQQIYSLTTSELGIIPVALMKHSSKIERSGSPESVRVGIEQAASL